MSCGDEITADAILDSDLSDCPNNGVVIGADGVTLDLNGHTIDGDGTEFGACAEGEICDVGVVNEGHDRVTVRGGAVHEFGVGVLVGGARNTRIVRISSSRHVFFGSVVFDSARSVIRDGSFSRNIAPEGDGIGLFFSHQLRVVHNEIRRNPGPGIHVDHSNANLIKRNVFSHSSDIAILMQGDRNRVLRNRFDRYGAGVIVGPGSRNVIARNRLLRTGDGIGIEMGRGNLVARNVVIGARGDGIYLGLDAPPVGGVDNVVRRNEVRRAHDDGFDVRKKDNHSVLTRNVAVGAGDDGFDIESRSTKLTRNRAVRNGDLGIEARRGVIDGGGNRARGNGDPAQCVHVGCH